MFASFELSSMDGGCVGASCEAGASTRAIIIPTMTMVETAVMIMVAAREVEGAMTMAVTVTTTDPAMLHLGK